MLSVAFTDPATAADPVDEEPRRHSGPPVLRGERTRSLEPNRVTERLKAVACGWARSFLAQSVPRVAPRVVPVMSMVSYPAMRTVYPVPARLRSRSNRSTDYPADDRANRATHHSAGYSARADTNGRITLSSGNAGEQRESKERREAD